jgi:murein DD-endopeptidase MepM/ murein hydrolase activator NlpD
VTLREGPDRLVRWTRTGPRSRLAALLILVPLVITSLVSAAPAVAVSASPAAAFRYVVQPGDTLWKLAMKHDSTVRALVQANRLENPDLIRVGQSLWIPAGQKAVAKATVARQQPAQRAVAVRRSSQTAVFPLKGFRGPVQAHWGGFRGAADLMASQGTPIYAVMGGRVLSSGRTEIGGWCLMIAGDDGREYYYAHFRERARVAAGEYVATGEHIANVGSTGNSSAPHLHIAIGDHVTRVGNAKGLRAGYGTNLDVPKFLNRLR